MTPSSSARLDSQVLAQLTTIAFISSNRERHRDTTQVDIKRTRECIMIEFTLWGHTLPLKSGKWN